MTLSKNCRFVLLFSIMLLLMQGCRCPVSSEAPLPDVTFPIAAVQSVPAETDLAAGNIARTPDVWKAILSSARKSIHLGMFYMISEKGSALEEIVELIEAKAAEGVRLKAVTDKAFYSAYPHLADRLAKLENSDIRIIDYKAVSGGVMHAKYFIVDGRHFYAGSANFDWRSLEHIREIGIAGTSPAIASELEKIFRADMRLASGKRPRKNKPRPADIDASDLFVTGTPAILLPSGAQYTEDVLVKMLDAASKEILLDVFQYGLTSPYAKGYYDLLDRALRRAAARGVDIKMMVSDWALGPEQQAVLKSLQAVKGVEVRYLQIPRHSGGFIEFARVSHTKMLLIDGKYGWTGSANWQPGYFDQSRNAGIATSDKDILGDLRVFFFRAWDSRYAKFLQFAVNYAPPRRQKDAPPAK